MSTCSMLNDPEIEAIGEGLSINQLYFVFSESPVKDARKMQCYIKAITLNYYTVDGRHPAPVEIYNTHITPYKYWDIYYLECTKPS